MSSIIPSITDSMVKAATEVIASESATTEDKIQMLIELAQGFQKQPKKPKDLRNAVSLYYQAYEMCKEDYPFLKARTMVGMASALQAIPAAGTDLLLQAKAGYEEALPIIENLATPQEIAEVQMNLGLVLQSLAGYNLARITDSIKAYQKALQVFTCEQFPQEYAILHNNIAIAHLSMPLSSEKEHLRHGLAVRSFETALNYIKLMEHPREYAMLQNNLGNALQYLPSSHPVDNNLRAISAYDEALKVRNPCDTPLEYANTIANKANALSNIPDDFKNWEAGNSKNLLQASNYYQEALEIFQKHEQVKQAEVVMQALREIQK
jgi:tetratricopeptide (TPR) repeat protein